MAEHVQASKCPTKEEPPIYHGAWRHVTVKQRTPDIHRQAYSSKSIAPATAEFARYCNNNNGDRHAVYSGPFDVLGGLNKYMVLGTMFACSTIDRTTKASPCGYPGV